jgi:hypothetical protein
MVIDKYLLMDQTIPMKELALVSRFFRRFMNKINLGEWMGKVWGKSMGYVPTFHILSQGLMVFVVKNHDDIERIKMRNWYYEMLC